MALTKGEDPVTGKSWSLTNPRSIVNYLVPVTLGFVGLLFAFGMASNKLLPFVNNLLGSVSPALSSQSSGIEVFD
jgi:hypothetical protein